MTTTDIAPAAAAADLAAAVQVKQARRAELRQQLADLDARLEAAREEHGRVIAAGGPPAGALKWVRQLESHLDGLRRAVPIVDAEIEALEREHRAATLAEAEAVAARDEAAALAAVADAVGAIRAAMHERCGPAYATANAAIQAAVVSGERAAALKGRQKQPAQPHVIDLVNRDHPGALLLLDAIGGLIAPRVMKPWRTLSKAEEVAMVREKSGAGRDRAGRIVVHDHRGVCHTCGQFPGEHAPHCQWHGLTEDEIDARVWEQHRAVEEKREAERTGAAQDDAWGTPADDDEPQLLTAEEIEQRRQMYQAKVAGLPD